MNKIAAALLAFVAFVAFVAVTACAAGDRADADAQAANAVSKPSNATPSCPTDVLRQFDGRSARIDPATLVLTEGNQAFPTALKGPTPTDSPHRFRSVALASDGYPSGPSLRYEVQPCSAECASPASSIYMQKVNHHFLYHDNLPTGLAFGERRYLGFAFQYDGDLPDREVIVFQLWQGSPFNPPFAAVAFQEKGELALKFVIRNKSTGSNPSAIPIELGRIPRVQRGAWIQFVLSVFPEHDAMPHRKGNRTLEIFAKTSSESNFESIAVHHGKLGYDPADSCHYAGKCDLTSKPNSTIDFKMGLYRHSDATHAVAFFDTVRLTTTFATAVPDYECSM